MKWFLSYILAFGLLSTCMAQECPVDSKTSMTAIRSFLEEQRVHADADGRCVTSAFIFLSHDVSSISTLIGYLDFRRPPTDEERQGLRTLKSTSGQYPAIAGLVQMGRPVVPYLLDTIRSSDSDVVRKNAAFALHMILPLCGEELTSTLQAEENKPMTDKVEQERFSAARKEIDGFRAYKKCDQPASVLR